jgi:hypothetical protein
MRPAKPFAIVRLGVERLRDAQSIAVAELAAALALATRKDI